MHLCPMDYLRGFSGRHRPEASKSVQTVGIVSTHPKVVAIVRQAYSGETTAANDYDRHRKTDSKYG